MEKLLNNIVRKEKFIGIDISATSVKILQFEKNKKNYKLISLGEKEIPITAFVAGVIRQKEIVSQGILDLLKVANPSKIKTKFAVVSLPDDQIFTQLVNIPKVEYSKIRETLSYQLPSFIPMKEDEIYWSYDILNETSDEYEIIITAVTKESSDSFIDTLSLANLTPLLFEPRSKSALRSILVKNDVQNEYMLIDIGKSMTTVSISKKDSIQYSSSFYFGLNQIKKIVGEYKKINDAEVEDILQKEGIPKKDAKLKEYLDKMFETLTGEIKKTINFYGEDKISKIFLYGDTLNIEGIEEYITPITKIHIEKAKPSLPIYPVLQWEKHEKISPYIPVIGIELINKVKNNTTINLLPAKTQRISILKFFVKEFLQLLNIILVNLFILSLLFIYLSFQNEITASNLRNEVTSYNRQINSSKYKGIAGTINKLNSDLNTVNTTYKNHLVWSPYITTIASVTPAGMAITRMTIKNVNSTTSATPIWQVKMSGVAMSRAQIISLSKTIESYKYFYNVTMPLSNFQTNANVPFILMFDIKT